MGWVYVAFLIATFIAASIFIARRAVKRWWEYLIILVMTALLVRPFLTMTGDVSKVLPDFWSDGADGKDQIVWVSIAATFTWPWIMAALLFWLVRWTVWRRG
ncbi:MAG: hypothetical protein HY242_07970 [Afipia sp.]|nr:hypothetical protein [Afipia sp.]